jgi:hypothetical protein
VPKKRRSHSVDPFLRTGIHPAVAGARPDDDRARGTELQLATRADLADGDREKPWSKGQNLVRLFEIMLRGQQSNVLRSQAAAAFRKRNVVIVTKIRRRPALDAPSVMRCHTSTVTGRRQRSALRYPEILMAALVASGYDVTSDREWDHALLVGQP